MDVLYLQRFKKKVFKRKVDIKVSIHLNTEDWFSLLFFISPSSSSSSLSYVLSLPFKHSLINCSKTASLTSMADGVTLETMTTTTTMKIKACTSDVLAMVTAWRGKDKVGK